MSDLLSNLCIVGLAVSFVAFLVILAAAGSSRRMYSDRPKRMGVYQDIDAGVDGARLSGDAGSTDRSVVA